ncbi:RsmB/NOP family class I SAM-dependent RNA methyltransferase [Flaviaesturariibacter flavus]|uniref:RsmB/NOP family class I SAM-dependent RNA methyltransferase n=1 Tax=Flaviaesturariibacter flavus TaxID=2502780 RepID=A0A4R1B8L2_9BACT|nr:RsmB/NOP family class I SAM-dependent RNA methyltransferase [Flaviaesturariibacter flavus]TCJ12399.1 RsmB/NOP family class I SAM-dependent RNA methyltransferase [Flaviaesturariibacter flavus]
MKVDAYIRSANTILGLYDGKTPFAGWLKEYFRKEKKFGSRDRRMVTQLCYGYFRLGNLLADRSREERILFAHEVQTGVASLPDDLLAVFPLRAHLSPEIDAVAFVRAQLEQPDLFLRTRPGRQAQVTQKLEAAGIGFSECAPDCIALPNGSKIDEVIAIDADAVVQDRSSQRVLDGLVEILDPGKSFSLWDCCAASGGKSILAADRFPKVQLTASDVRESILHNLRKRFARAGITRYRSFVADVGASTFSFPHTFDVVLCDAPCSGSGTWGRTPEQLTYFTEDRIANYASLQRRIAVNALQQVKKGGYFLYITCSVFAAENEANVALLQKESGLSLVDARYYKGYVQNADTLYAALFRL